MLLVLGQNGKDLPQSSASVPPSCFGKYVFVQDEAWGFPSSVRGEKELRVTRDKRQVTSDEIRVTRDEGPR